MPIIPISIHPTFCAEDMQTQADTDGQEDDAKINGSSNIK